MLQCVNYYIYRYMYMCANYSARSKTTQDAASLCTLAICVLPLLDTLLDVSCRCDDARPPKLLVGGTLLVSSEPLLR